MTRGSKSQSEREQGKCPTCGGTGKVQGIKYFGRRLEEECTTCQGTGERLFEDQDERDELFEDQE